MLPKAAIVLKLSAREACLAVAIAPQRITTERAFTHGHVDTRRLSLAATVAVSIFVQHDLTPSPAKFAIVLQRELGRYRPAPHSRKNPQ